MAISVDAGIASNADVVSRQAPVALVAMPFAREYRPSLPLSQLKADLAVSGIAADVHYLNLSFADFIGERSYHAIAVGQPAHQDLLGEWIFAQSLHGRPQIPAAGYVDEVLGRTTIDRRTVPDEDFMVGGPGPVPGRRRTLRPASFLAAVSRS